MLVMLEPANAPGATVVTVEGIVGVVVAALLA